MMHQFTIGSDLGRSPEGAWPAKLATPDRSQLASDWLHIGYRLASEIRLKGGACVPFLSFKPVCVCAFGFLYGRSRFKLMFSAWLATIQTKQISPNCNPI